MIASTCATSPRRRLRWACDDLLQAIDVVQVHAGDARGGGVDVARDGDVDKQQRAIRSDAASRTPARAVDDEVLGRRGADDDVGLASGSGRDRRMARRCPQIRRQLARSFRAAVRHEQASDAAFAQAARGELARLAGADTSTVLPATSPSVERARPTAVELTETA